MKYDNASDNDLNSRKRVLFTYNFFIDLFVLIYFIFYDIKIFGQSKKRMA